MGWAGWGEGLGSTLPPSQPPTPLTVMLRASARRQPESIFIPCLKISLSGSLAHDGSSFLRLPSGSSQLQHKEQSPASCKSPPHSSHSVKAEKGHHSPHAVGMQKYPRSPGAGGDEQQPQSCPSVVLCQLCIPAMSRSILWSLCPHSPLSLPCQWPSRFCAFFFPTGIL